MGERNRRHGGSKEKTSAFIQTTMLRCTRPLLQVPRRAAAAPLKQTTGLVGLAVLHNPIANLTETYTGTLSLLERIPTSALYRQSVEAIVQKKLQIIEAVAGDVDAAEKQLDEGPIEQSVLIAEAELKLASKMIEWKP